MIIIGEPKIKISDNRHRLEAMISVDGVESPLWFEVSSEYGQFLCSERSDAFVAGLMFVAIKQGHDICFEAPMSDELKDSIEHQFIEVICQHQPQLYHVKLIGPTASCLEKTRTVLGTGASCGVDCLYTIKRRIDGSQFEKYLLIANQHGHVVNDTDEKRQHRFSYLKRISNSLSDDLKIPLIICDTNYNSSEIMGLTFEGCTTYGNLFVVLALQKLFTKYFVASGGPVADFGKYVSGGIFGTDCSNYDLLTCQAFSTSALQFVVDGLEDRNVKVSALCEYPIAWRHLDVCHVHPVGVDRNCTNGCPKCMYTILEIMTQGHDALDRFSTVFDIPYVRSHMHQYAAELLRKRLIGAETAMETWPKRKSIGFTKRDYLMASWIVLKKIMKRLLRGGRVTSDFVAQ